MWTYVFAPERLSVACSVLLVSEDVLAEGVGVCLWLGVVAKEGGEVSFVGAELKAVPGRWELVEVSEVSVQVEAEEKVDLEAMLEVVVVEVDREAVVWVDELAGVAAEEVVMGGGGREWEWVRWRVLVVVCDEVCVHLEELEVVHAERVGWLADGVHHRLLSSLVRGVGELAHRVSRRPHRSHTLHRAATRTTIDQVG